MEQKIKNKESVLIFALPVIENEKLKDKIMIGLSDNRLVVNIKTTEEITDYIIREYRMILNNYFDTLNTAQLSLMKTEVLAVEL